MVCGNSPNLRDCALGPFRALNAPSAQVGRTSPFQVRSFFSCTYNGLTCCAAKPLRCVPNDAVGVRANGPGPMAISARIWRLGGYQQHGRAAEICLVRRRREETAQEIPDHLRAAINTKTSVALVSLGSSELPPVVTRQLDRLRMTVAPAGICCATIQFVHMHLISARFARLSESGYPPSVKGYRSRPPQAPTKEKASRSGSRPPRRSHRRQSKPCPKLCDR